MATAMKRKKVVTSPRIPGPGSITRNLKGEKETIHWDGEEVFVYIEPRPEGERSELRQCVNPVTGEKLWKDAPKGMMPKPMMERVELIPLYDETAPGCFEHPDSPGQWINPEGWREYVIDVAGNNTNHKVFNFREDPAIIARKAAEARRQKKLEEILDRLADGEDTDEIVATVKRGPGRPRKNPEAA